MAPIESQAQALLNIYFWTAYLRGKVGIQDQTLHQCPHPPNKTTKCRSCVME